MISRFKTFVGRLCDRSVIRRLKESPRLTLLALFVLGLMVTVGHTAYLLHPLGTGHGTMLDGGYGDSVSHIWMHWWIYHALVVEHTSPFYYTSYAGYPHGLSMVYHNVVLPFGLGSFPFFALGLEPSRIFLLWLYGFPVMGYVGTFLLLRELGASRLGSAAGGVYLAMSPYYWSHLPRLDTLMFLSLPVVLYFCLRMRDGPLKWGFAAVVSGAAVLMVSPYYGGGLLILWAVMLPVCTRFGLRYREYVWIGPLILLVTAFDWLPQALGDAPNLTVAADWEIRILYLLLTPPEELFSANLLGNFFPIPVNPLSHPYGTPFYLGYVALVLVAFTVWDRWNFTTAWTVLVGLLFLSIGFGNEIYLWEGAWLEGLTPYALAVRLFPLLSAFRLPAQFLGFVIVLTAIGVGLSGRWNSGWAALLLALIVVELWASPIPDTHVKAVPLRKHVAPLKEAVTSEAIVPIPLPRIGNEAGYTQMLHHKKLPIVPVIAVPPETKRFLLGNPVLKSSLRNRLPPEKGWRTLRELGYGGFILHRNPHPLKVRQRLDGRSNSWETIREAWRKKLRSRYGNPVVKNRFFEVFVFPDGNRGDPS